MNSYTMFTHGFPTNNISIYQQRCLGLEPFAQRHLKDLVLWGRPRVHLVGGKRAVFPCLRWFLAGHSVSQVFFGDTLWQRCLRLPMIANDYTLWLVSYSCRLPMIADCQWYLICWIEPPSCFPIVSRFCWVHAPFHADWLNRTLWWLHPHFGFGYVPVFVSAGHIAYIPVYILMFVGSISILVDDTSPFFA